MTSKRKKQPALCPKCGHAWWCGVKGKSIQCPKCKSYSPRKKVFTNTARAKLEKVDIEKREEFVADALQEAIITQYPELDIIDVISLKETIEEYKTRIEEAQREIAEELAHKIIRKSQNEYMKRKNLEKPEEEQEDEELLGDGSISEERKEKILEKKEERRKVNLG